MALGEVSLWQKSVNTNRVHNPQMSLSLNSRIFTKKKKLSLSLMSSMEDFYYQKSKTLLVIPSLLWC